MWRRRVPRYCRCGERLRRRYGVSSDVDGRYDQWTGRRVNENWWWMCFYRRWPWGGGSEHTAIRIPESGARRRLRPMVNDDFRQAIPETPR